MGSIGGKECRDIVMRREEREKGSLASVTDTRRILATVPEAEAMLTVSLIGLAECYIFEIVRSDMLED
jgi:hypothetical protein